MEGYVTWIFDVAQYNSAEKKEDFSELLKLAAMWFTDYEFSHFCNIALRKCDISIWYILVQYAAVEGMTL